MESTKSWLAYFASCGACIKYLNNASALANTQASASKQTPQLSLRAAMSALCPAKLNSYKKRSVH